MRFERCADAYDDLAGIQRDCARALVATLVPKGVGIDVGSGTGFVQANLNYADLLQVDLSPAMLVHGQGARVACDARRLPLPDACIDFAVSNMALQWIGDASDLIRVMKPGARLHACVVLDGSLPELAEARDRAGLASAVQLPNAAHWIHQFPGAQIRIETRRCEFDSPVSALRSVRGLGATLETSMAVSRAQYRRLMSALPTELTYQLAWIEWQK